MDNWFGPKFICKHLYLGLCIFTEGREKKGFWWANRDAKSSKFSNCEYYIRAFSYIRILVYYITREWKCTVTMRTCADRWAESSNTHTRIQKHTYLFMKDIKMKIFVCIKWLILKIKFIIYERKMYFYFIFFCYCHSICAMDIYIPLKMQ